MSHSHTISTCSHLINDTIPPDLKIWDIDTCEHLRAWIRANIFIPSTYQRALFYSMQSYCMMNAINVESNMFPGWWWVYNKKEIDWLEIEMDSITREQ